MNVNIRSNLFVVNKLLKYIIVLILTAICFTGGLDKLNSSDTKSLHSDVIIKNSSYVSDSWISDISLYLPEQTSSINIVRIPNTPQRTHSIQKNPFESIKVNKLTSIGIRNFINKKSLIIYSAFIKPTHRLVCLGKFLI